MVIAQPYAFDRPPRLQKRSKTAWFDAAQSWDYRRVKEVLREALELLAASNPNGLNTLHMACAVEPGKPGLHEANGIKTVTALLGAGIDIESVAFRDDDGSDWRVMGEAFSAADFSRGRS